MPVNVNIPHRVTIDLEGNLTIQTIKQEKYTLATPDAIFHGFLRNDILDAFAVANVVLQSGENDFAAVSVNIDAAKGTAFGDSLAKQLDVSHKDGAVPTAPTASNLVWLEKYLLDFAQVTLEKQLVANGIASTLTGSIKDDIEHIGVAADYSAGASAMFSGLQNITPELRALVATQIPNSKWISASTPSTKLPMYDGGDSFTLQFIITQDFEVTQEIEDNHGTSEVFGSAAPGVSHYNVGNRVINVVLTRPPPGDNVALREEDAGDEVSVTGPPSTIAAAISTFYGHNATAKTAYNAWKAKNDLVVAAAKASLKKTEAQEQYDDAVAQQTLAVAAMGTLTSGVEFEHAKDAKVAVAQAKVVLDAAVAAETTAVNANNASSTSLATLASALDTANTAVKNDIAALNGLSTALNTANTAAAADRAANAFYKYKLEQIAAASESALQYFQHLDAKFVLAETAANTAIAAHDISHSAVSAADADNVTKQGAIAALQSAYDAAPTAANALALATAKDAAGKAEEFLLAALAAYETAHNSAKDLVEVAQALFDKLAVAASYVPETNIRTNLTVPTKFARTPASS